MAYLVPTLSFRWLIRTMLVPTMHDGGDVKDMPREVARTLQQAYQNTDTGIVSWQAVPEVKDFEQ